MPVKNIIELSVNNLTKKMQSENKYFDLSLEDFLKRITINPELALRNVFQLIYDMMHYYIPEGENEYPNDPESINYINYDCSNLFINDVENPFFADRLFANTLINVISSFRQGVVTNKMLLFTGPHGSGKSTFLNNFLYKLECFTKIDEGTLFETVWRLEVEKFENPLFKEILKKVSIEPLEPDLNNNDTDFTNASAQTKLYDKYIIVPCPSHDHPIIQIPQQYRKKLLDEIIEDKEFKRKLFYNKEYEWVFKKQPCTICTSIFKSLSKKLTADEILKMLFAKRYEFDRKMGDGVSIYNSGDVINYKPIRNRELQKWLDTLFRDSEAVTYTYSQLAKTNNGIYAIMDAKSNNIDRIKNIHSIISDGIHKVDIFEETIDSLFVTLINPEDINVISEEKSFLDRVIKIPIPYIRDYSTETEIYRNVYGGGINNYFLPGVLESFAKTICSSRLNKQSPSMNQWIKDRKKYFPFCDKNLFLLKLDIYSGNIPFWLTEEDRKTFTRTLRHELILEGGEEGCIGFSGRDSLEMFNSFYSKYKRNNSLININNLYDFFSEKQFSEKLSQDFLESLQNLYNYTVLQEIKESMFFYNDEQISNNIVDYLFAINHEIGANVISPYTKNKITVSEDYFNLTENIVLNNDIDKHKFRNDALKLYVSKTLQEVKSGKNISKTEQYIYLHSKYNQNLKQNILSPFVNNKNFRRGIKDFGKDSFNNYDKRVKEEVKLLMKNLIFKFNYTQKGAKQVSLYVVDNDICSKFLQQ